MLYLTNTVHISSVVLMCHLSLLLPQRLASIASLELVRDLVVFRPLPNPQREQEKGWPAYNTLASMVASAFPCLRKLYISIQTNSFISSPVAGNIESHERKFLGPIDEMVRKLGPYLQDCRIALPHIFHKELMYRAEIVGSMIDSGGQGAVRWWQFWRPLPVE